MLTLFDKLKEHMEREFAKLENKKSKIRKSKKGEMKCKK